MKILPRIFGLSPEERDAVEYRKLIREEAKIGGQLFGPVPEGHHREFFCLDEHTWIWHEEWNDQTGHHVVTTRYDVRPNGILKIQNNGQYQPLSEAEARNLYRAVQLYGRRMSAVYAQPIAG